MRTCARSQVRIISSRSDVPKQVDETKPLHQKASDGPPVYHQPYADEETELPNTRISPNTGLAAVTRHRAGETRPSEKEIEGVAHADQ